MPFAVFYDPSYHGLATLIMVQLINSCDRKHGFEIWNEFFILNRMRLLLDRLLANQC